jgi:Lectin C-type domain/Leucine Rich repeats (2 copies)
MNGDHQSKITLGSDNPWPGLNQFFENHGRYFRGRDEEKLELCRLVKSEILTILFGKSGLGKSSLLQAGLFPLLRQEGYLPVLIHIRHDDLASDDRDGASPLGSQVYAALREACAARKVEAPEIRDEERLWEYFHRAGAAFWNERNRLVTPVLVFDQFEEAFTLGIENDLRRKRRDTFLAQLEELIENRPPQTLRRRWDDNPELVSDFEQDRTPCKIILSLREDFLPDLEQLKEGIRSIMQNRFRLERMDGGKAWQVVTGETMVDGETRRTLSHLVDEEVALKIIDFVSKTRGQRDQAALTRENLRARTVDPALLSVVCSELNNRRCAKKPPQEKISFTLLSDSKEEIIREFFDGHVNALGAGAGPVRRFIEEDLITGGGFRKRCDLDDALRQQGVSRDDLRRLEQQRILRFEPSEGITWIELTHDLLTEVVYESRGQRREREERAKADAAAVEKKRKVLFYGSILVVILLIACSFGGYLYIDWRNQLVSWTPEIEVDFSKAPPKGPPSADTEQTSWLKENFDFRNPEATSEAKPWSVHDGAMLMEKQKWCWLKNVRIRGDTKVVVELQFDKPEAFQICINAKKKLRQRDNNPPGYSCRFGIWDGSMNLITREEFDRANDFNSLVLSPIGGGNGVSFKLTFIREGNRVSLQVNDKEVHHETYLVPLFAERDAQPERTEDFENIGIRTWGTKVNVRKLSAYRKKLAEMASPIIAADALVEAGDLMYAIEKYKTIAKDYEVDAPSISTDALIKGYLVAIKEKREEDFQSRFRNASSKKYQDKIREVETLKRWLEGQYADALHNIPRIFEENAETDIAVECLHAEHKPLGQEVSAELLRWIGRTTKLAGLDISSFGMTNLGALAAVPSLRGLDCRNNQLTGLDPLRSMDQLRALYCGQNRIGTLEPIKTLPLIVLDCDLNQIESLEPLSGMAQLNELYCGGNQIKDLSPLKRKSIYALDCSHNNISSLDPIKDLPELLGLYCGSNQIRSIEPLRKVKNLQYLDCSINEIQTLEPLKDLQLYSLDCSGNPIVTLEPFVDARNPPGIFAFDDCRALPEAEIEHAINVWQTKGLRSNASYGEFALARKRGDVQVKELAQRGDRGHRYLFVQKYLSTAAAEKFCESLGGHLATITSEPENEFLKTITPNDASYRIGLKFFDGAWHWVTGEALDINFMSALTDFRSTDKIVAWKNGSWLPSQEDKPMQFIVEWE